MARPFNADPVEPISSSSSGSGGTFAPASSSSGLGYNTGGGGSGDMDFAVTPGAAATPKQAPPWVVGPDMIVEISPDPTNALNVFYSTQGPNQANGNGPRVVLVPSAQPRLISVYSLAEIWVVAGNATDKVLITVRKR